MADAKDELKSSLESLRKAADAVVDQVLGKDVRGHLREAAKHTLRAVKAAVDEAERKLDERADKPSGG